jgi:hypothetical protein
VARGPAWFRSLRVALNKFQTNFGPYPPDRPAFTTDARLREHKQKRLRQNDILREQSDASIGNIRHQQSKMVGGRSIVQFQLNDLTDRATL